MVKYVAIALIMLSSSMILGCSKEDSGDKNMDLSNAGAVQGGGATRAKEAPAKGMSPDSLTVPGK